MMYSGVVSDIRNELDDWLNSYGGKVTDQPLSLINRAIEQLWMRRDWDMLRKNYTLSIVNNVALLPSDYGRMIFVGRDSDSDGVIDWFYSNEARDRDKRYEFENTLSATNQITLSIKFPFSPVSTPTLRYMMQLNKVVNDTDNMFFPATLVLRTAQKIHAIDKSISGTEINAISNDWKELIVDYEDTNYHIDRSMQNWQQDMYFNQISVEGYSLNGDGISDFIPDRSNSEDR